MKQQNINNQQLSEMVSPLLQWYDDHARILPWRDSPEPYAVWISEIMLQQTRVEAVKPYFERWMDALPDLPSLANASEQEVMKLWEGLGYYSRARNLQKAAKFVMENHNGILPSSFEALLKLPGIGEYSAGSIGSIAFQLPVPCVDGNVMRVITRITANSSDIALSGTKRLITEWVREIIPPHRPGDFNQALMELGATVCLPNGLPKCQQCPVAFLCQAQIQNRTADFPVKTAKQPRKKEKRTVLILINKNKVALRQRPDTGLLAALWEFPNFQGELSEHEMTSLLSEMGISVESLEKSKKAKHIFTHIEWHMSGYLAIAENPVECAEFQWIDINFLKEELALPAAFNPYLQTLDPFIDPRII